MTALRLKYLNLNAQQRFVTEDCTSCGEVFAMSEQTYNARCSDHRGFWCPACGRAMHYTGPTETQKLKQELEAARSLAARESERRRKAEGEKTAARGELNQIRNRVGNGVCPCCQRTFANLGEHMAGQHPDFRLDAEEPNPLLTLAALTENQISHVRTIGRHVELGDPGLPLQWGHRGTLAALERRGVVTIEHHIDAEDGWEYDAAVPTTTGFRLIAEAGAAR